MNAGKPSPPKAPQMRHIQKSWSRPDPANNLVRPTVGKVTQQNAQKMGSAGHRGQRSTPVVVPAAEAGGIALLSGCHALTRKSGNQRNAHVSRLQSGDVRSAHGWNARARPRLAESRRSLSGSGTDFPDSGDRAMRPTQRRTACCLNRFRQLSQLAATPLSRVRSANRPDPACETGHQPCPAGLSLSVERT